MGARGLQKNGVHRFAERMGSIGLQKNGVHRFAERMVSIGLQKKGSRVSPYTTNVSV